MVRLALRPLSASPSGARRPVRINFGSPPSRDGATRSKNAISTRIKVQNNTSTQESASNVFDNRHANTYRLAQSITAPKYRNPRGIGMYFTSALHTWCGRSISTPCNKYGYI